MCTFLHIFVVAVNAGDFGCWSFVHIFPPCIGVFVIAGYAGEFVNS